jgi:hypothetical protein
VDMFKCQRHSRSGAGRRGVSQANEAANNPKLTGLCQHEIVSAIVKIWKQCGMVQASCGCLVGHLSVSEFLPHTSATLRFQVLTSMQMDAYLKKEQIGTLFVRVGAPEGGGRGWVVGQLTCRGVQPQKCTCLQKNSCPLATA